MPPRKIRAVEEVAWTVCSSRYARILRSEIERVTGGDMRKQPMEKAANTAALDWDLKELMERLERPGFLRELMGCVPERRAHELGEIRTAIGGGN